MSLLENFRYVYLRQIGTIFANKTSNLVRFMKQSQSRDTITFQRSLFIWLYKQGVLFIYKIHIEYFSQLVCRLDIKKSMFLLCLTFLVGWTGLNLCGSCVVFLSWDSTSVYSEKKGGRREIFLLTSIVPNSNVCRRKIWYFFLANIRIKEEEASHVCAFFPRKRFFICRKLLSFFVL